METLPITSRSYTLSDFLPALQDPIKVELDRSALESIRKSNKILNDHLKKGTKIYGVTTGFGKLSQFNISAEDRHQLQLNLVRSHAAGVGEPFETGIVRTAMLIKLLTFARGASGVREDVANQLVHFINHDIIPVVPCKGSVGASGDLAPLSQIALALIGESDVEFDGSIIPATEALLKTNGHPLELHAKEGLSLINGTQISTALGLKVLSESKTLLDQADLIGAVSVEASLSSATIFKPEIHALKAHPGQRLSAKRIYAFLDGSEIVQSHTDCDRTQDPYSFRCIPHVHGASRDMIAFTEEMIIREANSVSDNPLIFENGDVISSGHFHGEAVAQALDALAIAVCEIGAISERRTHYFMKGIDDRIPAFVAVNPGLESGLMLAHVTATALASENKTLSHPASVDSLPSSGGQEDQVSMAPWAGQKAQMIVDNVRKILAIELLTSYRATSLFHKDLKPGIGTLPVLNLLSNHLNLPVAEFSPGPIIEKIDILLKNNQGLQ